ncbi:Exportin-6 [Trichinella nativa]|uniref:Exportin-6 n=1 Tax=Trichinella nativa TaxID=6335 RepID=A0A0V1LTI8_9BILA|nr:Exportin-6 [Trichinella nativa]
MHSVVIAKESCLTGDLSVCASLCFLSMNDEAFVCKKLTELLHEVVNPVTTNERRKEIYSELEVFENKNAVEYCFNILRTSANDMLVKSFLLNILEVSYEEILQKVVKVKWNEMALPEQELFASKCYDLAVKFHTENNQISASKTMAIFGSIGCRSWPHRFPEFFADIGKCILNQESRRFGLKLLMISLEEFNKRDGQSGLLYEQEKTLLQNMKKESASILNFLLECLNQSMKALLENYHNFNATFNESRYQDYLMSVLNYFYYLFAVKTEESLSVIELKAEELCLEINCISRIFAFEEFDCLVENIALCQLFALAMIGLFPSVVDNEAVVRVSRAAFGCFLHLLMQPKADKVVGKIAFETFILCIANRLVELFTKYNQGNKLQTGEMVEEKSSIKIASELAEVVRCYFSNYLLPGQFFHESVLKYMEDTLQIYIKVLDDESLSSFFCSTWACIAESMKFYMHGSYPIASNIVAKYQCIFQDIINVFFEKTLKNCSIVNDLYKHLCETDKSEIVEDETVEDNIERIIVCIGQLDFTLVWNLLMGRFNNYLTSAMTYWNKPLNEFFEESESERLCIWLRQFCFVLRICWSLAPMFVETKDDSLMQICYAWLKQFDVFFSLCRQQQFFMNAEIPAVFEQLLSRLMSMTFITFGAYAPWVSQIYSTAQMTGVGNEEISSIISTVVGGIAELLAGDKKKMDFYGPSISTLHAVLLIIRPQAFVLHTPGMKMIYSNAIKGKYDFLPDKMKNVLHGSLASYLILPWFNSINCEQEWDERKVLYKRLIDNLLLNYLDLLKTENTVLINLETLSQTAPVVAELMRLIEGENEATKEICFEVWKPIGQGTLRLLRSIPCSSGCSEKLLDILTHIMQPLATNFGINFCRSVIQTFVSITLSKQFTYWPDSSNIIMWFLLTLKTVVREHKGGFIQLLPEIVAFVNGELRSLIVQKDVNVDVKEKFYDLVFNILDFRWRYFFPSKITLSTLNSDAFPEHPAEFQTLLQCLWLGMKNENTFIIKSVLCHLVKLNNRWSLFRRAVFRQQFATDFMMVIVENLANRIHSILTDSLCETLASMVCIDQMSMQVFTNDVLNPLLNHQCRFEPNLLICTINRLQQSLDSPSFILQMKHIVHDIRVTLA